MMVDILQRNKNNFQKQKLVHALELSVRAKVLNQKNKNVVKRKPNTNINKKKKKRSKIIRKNKKLKQNHFI